MPLLNCTCQLQTPAGYIVAQLDAPIAPIPLLTNPIPACRLCLVLACRVLLCCLQVQRAKKCLDFAGTILVIHLVVVTCFSGFPKSLAW